MFSVENDKKKSAMCLVLPLFGGLESGPKVPNKTEMPFEREHKALLN